MTEFITLEEAAAVLRVTPNTIRRYMKDGDLLGFQTKPGSAIRIDSRDFSDFIAKGRRPEENNNHDTITKAR